MVDTNRQWILVRRPSGPITNDCLELRESPVPEPADGQFLVQDEYLSCDPAQRLPALLFAAPSRDTTTEAQTSRQTLRSRLSAR